jgi:hypothetical protein
MSHATVYLHVATKAELRGLVVGRWVGTTMPALRAIAARPGPAPQRLRRLFDALKVFAAYRTLALMPSPSSPPTSRLDLQEVKDSRTRSRSWVGKFRREFSRSPVTSVNQVTRILSAIEQGDERSRSV